MEGNNSDKTAIKQTIIKIIKLLKTIRILKLGYSNFFLLKTVFEIKVSILRVFPKGF